jgi:predicted nucleic acid-binding protein
MKRVVVDTDILVDHLHEIEEAKLVIERARRREIIAYISAITELELLSGKECKS